MLLAITISILENDLDGLRSIADLLRDGICHTSLGLCCLVGNRTGRTGSSAGNRASNNVLGSLNTLNANQLGLEDCNNVSATTPRSVAGKLTQSAAGRDSTHVPLAVAKGGWNGQKPLLANAHIQQSLVPSKRFVNIANSVAMDHMTYPLMTWPLPTVKEKGLLRFTLESKTLPLLAREPV